MKWKDEYLYWQVLSGDVKSLRKQFGNARKERIHSRTVLAKDDTRLAKTG